jgi:hypothetical protein
MKSARVQGTGYRVQIGGLVAFSDVDSQLVIIQVEEILKIASPSPSMDSISIQPLIRLRVEYTGFSSVNPTRFGQHFVGRVANPNDILNFFRKKTTGEFLPFFS